jgi:hypothetical protein
MVQIAAPAAMQEPATIRPMITDFGRKDAPGSWDASEACAAAGAVCVTSTVDWVLELVVVGMDKMIAEKDVEEVATEVWDELDDEVVEDVVLVPVVVVVVTVFAGGLVVVVVLVGGAWVTGGTCVVGVGVGVGVVGVGVTEVLVEGVGSAIGLIGTSSVGVCLFFLIIRWFRSTCSARLTIGGVRFIPWRAWALGMAVRDNWATTAVKTRVKNERRAIAGEY